MHALALPPILAQAAGGSSANLLFLVAIVVVFYLMLIRPQQRKAKQHQELVKSTDVGDRIVTIGGIHGTVETMDEETVRIEVAPGTVITMARAAIARKLVDADTGGADDDAADDRETGTGGAVVADPSDPAGTA
ncbi:MAG: preprotein translocase subunit YajC [Aldersonia sp.]|nr:preprotein translocase subunit YajC [Aldersonia sp.]